MRAVVTVWECHLCDVGGTDIGAVTCWYCDGPVVVTAQPTLEVDYPPVAQALPEGWL